MIGVFVTNPFDMPTLYPGFPPPGFPSPGVPIPDDDPMDLGDYEDDDDPMTTIRTYRKPRVRASDARRRSAINTSGTALKSKTPGAVYVCSIPATDHDRIHDELCPLSLGWNISFNHPETRKGRTSWYAMIVNAKSTGQSDLRDEINRVFGYDYDDIIVLKVMGVGFIGGMEHVGTTGPRPKLQRRGERGEITNGHPLL